MEKYDVIFIGSGHACWHGALTLTLAGKKVAMVDRDVLGGTCTNYGCDAKILLDSPFEYVDGLQNYEPLGITSAPAVDWSRLMAYKKEQIGVMPMAMAGLFQRFGIPVLQGQGKLVDAHTVRVGETDYAADYIVIGTGARPAVRDIPGKEYLHDSREFLDVDVFPDRLVILGTGIIAMEFASIALKLKKEVTILAHGDKALREYPQKYVQRLIADMEREGARFCWNQDVSEVVQNGESYTVKTAKGLAVDCDYILNATGRVANVEGLGLEELGIQASAKGIVVDDHLRTTLPNIYASGDVVDKRIPKLTPTAAFESDYIAAQILGMDTDPIRYPAIPNLVFTLPRISQTGVGVDEAEKHPDRYRVVSVPYGQMMLWNARNEADLDITFVFDKADNHLAGAAVYGSDAGSWIDVLTIIINQKLGAAELGKMIFAFPTPTYGLISTLLTQFNAR